ncbi:hypothetical protein Ccrd_010143 [Cynara cardunculus var. scolymus]|uniref:Uncharacterized protein n=1 Tax=Cynara cardunculus var. scolymus TaxID=59895 RepID=A0A103YLM7_CYNCS|nr:hypothetical protein Ccrd_010143 [Cynara cardunculus var. scolymus]
MNGSTNYNKDDSLERGAMEYTIVVAETADSPATLQYLTPYTGAVNRESWCQEKSLGEILGLSETDSDEEEDSEEIETPQESAAFEILETEDRKILLSEIEVLRCTFSKSAHGSSTGISSIHHRTLHHR